jgi:hypothetical protein
MLVSRKKPWMFTLPEWSEYLVPVHWGTHQRLAFIPNDQSGLKRKKAAADGLAKRPK